MEAQESMACELAFLPVIRNVFRDGQQTVGSGSARCSSSTAELHEYPGFLWRPQRVQMFLAGYIHRCREERCDTEEI